MPVSCLLFGGIIVPSLLDCFWDNGARSFWPFAHSRLLAGRVQVWTQPHTVGVSDVRHRASSLRMDGSARCPVCSGWLLGTPLPRVRCIAVCTCSNTLRRPAEEIMSAHLPTPSCVFRAQSWVAWMGCLDIFLFPLSRLSAFECWVRVSPRSDFISRVGYVEVQVRPILLCVFSALRVAVARIAD